MDTITKQSNSNPIYQDKQSSLWYFWDETWAFNYGPYQSEELAIRACKLYCKEVLGI